MDILNGRLTVMVAVLSWDGHCIPYKITHFLNNALIYNQAFYPKGQTPYPLEDTLHSRIPSKFSSSDFTFGNCTVTLHLSREIITTVESY